MSEKEFLEKALNVKYDLLPMGNDTFTLVAKRDFSDVKKGDVGGIIDKDVILSHTGDCWIYKDSIVTGKAVVVGDSKISGKSFISAKKKFTILDSTISNSIIKVKQETAMEFCILDYAEIYSEDDFKCVNIDESVTVYNGVSGVPLIYKEGFCRPYKLMDGLELLNYSNYYDDIVKESVEFYRKITSTKTKFRKKVSSILNRKKVACC